MKAQKSENAKTTAAKKPATKATATKKFAKRFELQEFATFEIGFNDRHDSEIIIELDRETEALPQIKVLRYVAGELKSTYTIYDVDA